MTRRNGRNLLITLVASAGLAMAMPIGAAQAHPPAPTRTGENSLSIANVGSGGWGLSANAAKSLTVQEPYRHSGIHITPSLQWYENHSTAATTGPLPAPTCTLATDNSSDDAHLSLDPTGTQYNSLDISGFGISTAHGSLTARLSVESLSDGPAGTPALAGDGDLWYVQWTWGTDPTIKGYFLEAQYPGSSGNFDSSSGLPIDFSYGDITTSPTGGDFYNTSGSATGSVDLQSNTITMSAPLSALGGVSPGDALKSATAESYAEVGTPAAASLQSVDTLATTSRDYVVGDAYPTCPLPLAPGGTGTTGGGTASNPGAGSSSNLAYYGGPIVHKITNYLIFWLPQTGTSTGPDGNSCPQPALNGYNYEPPTFGSGSDANYEGILSQYFKDLQGTSFYNLMGQYADRSSGVINNNESLGGTWTDPCGYSSTATPAAPSVPGGLAANPVYDYDLQNEVLRAIHVNHWPEGLGDEYFVYLGFGVATCFDPSTTNPTGNAACDISGAPPAFCAYHGDFTDPNNGNTVLYGNMTDAGLQTAFSCYESPIDSGASPAHTVDGTTVHDYVADAEVSITSHEQFETDTDAMVGTAQTYAPPLGWYDPVGGEIGDKCAYDYGHFGSDGANISLQHGDRYIVQQEWSNWANGCALGDSAGTGPAYGGAPNSVSINQGWNLIDSPKTGLNSSIGLANDMQRTGQLPAGSVHAVATFDNGVWNVSVPGYSPARPISRSDGIFVLSGASGTWQPSGSVYTSPPTLNFNPGWNLVSSYWPNPGVTTDSFFNQIEAQNHACQGDSFTNAACDPTVDAIDTYGPHFNSNDTYTGSDFFNWSPAPPDTAGNASWPEPIGNQIPYTNGMWINSKRALSWTPQAPQCQTITAGMCS